MDTQEQTLIKDLRETDIFAGLGVRELEQIAKACTQHTYKAGQQCAIQGETIDELRIVNGGKVAIELRLEVVPYTQTLSITTLTKGNAFAWSALVGQDVHTVSARCIDSTKIICIKASDLQQIFKERPSIERVVMKNLASVINSQLKDSRTQLVRLVAEMIKQGR